MDTKGPEVRTTAIAGGEPIPYQIGDKVKIVGNPAQETTRECIAVSYPGFVHDLQVDGDILIDDGDLELRVIEKTNASICCVRCRMKLLWVTVECKCTGRASISLL